jgi:predicted TIM-barrel fold metal-dependent hydrolase
MLELSPKVDVHTHYIPPLYVDALRAAGRSSVDGIPAPSMPAWSPEGQLAHMDRLNIRRAYLSVSSPGVHLTPGNDVPARELARACNDYGASLVRQHPDRLGLFASLPLPDVQGSVDEAVRANGDECAADGFELMTNSHGVYVGDPSLDPVWETLDALSAVVALHPTTPCLPASTSNTDAGMMPGPLEAQPLGDRYMAPIFEFQLDTARAVANLILTGALVRFPHIKWIVPHAGGAVPPLLDRIAGFAAAGLGLPDAPKVSPDDVRALLRSRLYWDIAGNAFPRQICGLLPHLGDSLHEQAERLMYGSDFPWTTGERCVGLARDVEEGVRKAWNDAESRTALFSGSAERIFASRG